MVLDPNSSYSSAYTPVPYFLGHVFYRIHPCLLTVRILNAIIFVLSVLIAYKLFFQVTKKAALTLAAFYALNPYLLRAGYLYLMSNYGILFALIGIYFYFYYKGNFQFWIAHISWLLAVLSMQWMLMIYVAIILYEFEQYILDKNKVKEFFKLFLIKMVSLMPAFYLFYLWQGLTHPNFHAHTLKSSLPHFDAVLAVLGFWFFFFIVQNIRKIKWQIFKTLIFITPILLMNLPMHSNNHGNNVITGIVSSLCEKVELISGFPYDISTGILVLLGAIGLILIWEETDNELKHFLYIASGLITAFSASVLLGASHIFIMIPFIIFALQRVIVQRKAIFNLLLIQSLTIVVVYNLYIIFLRPYGAYFVG